MSTADERGPEPTRRLGYLLKHAQLHLAQLTSQALAPYGISGRQLAVLLVLAGGEPPSQQEAAGRLGIDRTTMVGFLDVLEDNGLVARRPAPDDRRRNVVVLTDLGHRVLREATAASEEAERRFLTPLSRSAADGLRRALAMVVERQAAS